MAVKLERVKPQMAKGETKLQRRKPTDTDFESVFEDEDSDPFAGVEAEDLQESADARMSEALRQIIERKKATQERFRVATDPEFFAVVCFQSREQRDAFMEKAGWEPFAGKYVNGLDVARKMSVEIEVVPIEPLKLRGKPNKFKASDILGKE